MRGEGGDAVCANKEMRGKFDALWARVHTIARIRGWLAFKRTNFWVFDGHAYSLLTV